MPANRGSLLRSFFSISMLSLILFTGTLLWLSPRYQTNDDVAMNLYASGTGLSQMPSEFLMFQHFSVGLILKSLYSSLPSFPWYGALFYTCLFSSSLIIGYAILRLNARAGPVGLWVVTLFLFYLKVIISPQFTIIAGYVAIAGVLLLYSALYKPNASTRTNAFLLTIAAALLILAGLIRFDSLMLSLVLMLPMYVHLLMIRSAATLRRLLPILCCVVFASWLLNRTQLAYYERSPGWKGFYSYNSVRADFVDRNKLTWDEKTKPLFAKVGWSKNDLAMIGWWFYLDPKVYSYQNLLFLSRNAPFVFEHNVGWSEFVLAFKDSFSLYSEVATLVLCVSLLVKGDRIIRSVVVLSLLWCLAIAAAIIVIERHLPLRVWSVMLFGSYVTGLMLWCDAHGKSEGEQSPGATPRLSRKLLAIVVPAIYVVCCWIHVRAIIDRSNIYQSLQSRLRKDLARLQPRADQLFVVWGGDFPYQEFQLPTHARPVAPHMQLLGLGVGNNTPIVQNRLKAFGINDLYQSFYTRDDVFLICNQKKSNLLIRYIQEHYHTKVEIKTIFKGAAFSVNKVRKLPG